MKRRKARCQAFSLVELLVVLGVLVCLVGILLPALSRAREHSRRALCLSNLRQLTGAWLGYASDNESRICSSQPEYVAGLGPPLFFWSWIAPVGGQKGLEMGKLWPYLKTPEVYRCPDDATQINNTTDQMDGVLSNSSSYQINSMLAGNTMGPPAYFYLNDVHQPAGTFVFIEGCSELFLLKTCFITPTYPNANVFRPSRIVNGAYVAGSLPGENHHGTNNAVEGTGISFADGHASFWAYADPRTGSLRQGIIEGYYGLQNVEINSIDVFQLEAWSGGQIPPGVSQ